MTTYPDLAVSTDRLTKHFGDLVAVDAIDLQVEPGTVMSLLGPNGAGKTTTVRMLATLSAPTSGSATVCGHDVVREADAVRSVISLTGQFAALEDNLTARENLMLMARLRGFGKAAATRVVDSLIDRFDIGEFRDKLIKAVSGGQRRRVDLAASLVVKPRLLVLDEPTSGLDPRSRQVVWSTVRDLVDEGVTLLLTTQYLEEADALADNIVLIDHGRAVASGTPSELKARIGDQRVAVVAVDGRGLDDLVRCAFGTLRAERVPGAAHGVGARPRTRSKTWRLWRRSCARADCPWTRSPSGDRPSMTPSWLSPASRRRPMLPPEDDLVEASS